MPDPITSDTSFDFLDHEFIGKAAIYTAAKELAAKLRSFKASHCDAYNKLSEAVFADVDLNLGDAANIFYSLIGALQND